MKRLQEVAIQLKQFKQFINDKMGIQLVEQCLSASALESHAN